MGSIVEIAQVASELDQVRDRDEEREIVHDPDSSLGAD
jgi:hypothetical protein